MVLQRGGPVPVWGTDKPGTVVSVLLNGKQVATATADATGNFRANLPAIEGVGPHTLSVVGSSKVELRDILVGEVWICSGQSNMEWPVRESNDPAKEIADAANHPTIRLLQIPRVRSTEPQSDVGAKWEVCSPDSVDGFSAVGYSFGRMLSRELGVPIGLINTSWGGTHAEAWTPRTELIKLPGMSGLFAGTSASYQREWNLFAPKFAEWLETTGRGWSDDSKIKAGWATVEFDDAAWEKLKVPGFFQAQGHKYNATVWYRNTVELPVELKGKELSLELGAVDDFDQTFVNGQLVGTTDQRTVNFWQAPRKYVVPAALTGSGKLTIAVRVNDHGGNGGFASGANLLRVGQGNTWTPLAGEWKFAVERVVKITGNQLAPPMPATGDIMASELYNAMLHPLAPMSIQGAIWYQGESNAGKAPAYEQLMATLITSWRTDFEKPQFPFLVVQLADFMEDSGDPAFDTGWARLREAQRQLTLNLPNTALAVTIDIGDAKDIHPRNKQDVGTRLARQALAMTYAKQIVRSGPTVKSIAGQPDGSVKIIFDNVAEGIQLKDLTGPAGFVLGDASGKFAWATVKIDSPDTLTLTAPSISKPAVVRYAWGNNPNAGLINSEKLPAVPFEEKIK